MKNLLKSLMFLSVFGSLLGLSGCYPGITEFGYVYNPMNLAAIAKQSLETGNLEEWNHLFSNHAYCVYANAKGFNTAKKTIRKSVHANSELVVDRLRLTGKSGALEVYELDIVNSRTRRLIFDAVVQCERSESHGSCKIIKLQDHIGSEPNHNGVCDDLRIN